MTTPVAPYTLFAGVDIAAATATAAWLTPGTAPKKPVTFDQTPAGFATLQRHLAATGVPAAQTLVVLEATGTYWIPLAVALHTAGYAVSVINPAQAHYFAQAQLKRAKTDSRDAQILAQFAQVFQPARWEPPPQVYHELAQRLAQRQTLLDMRQALRNQLHALTAGAVVVPAVQQRLEALIATLTEQIKALEGELAGALTQEATWAANVALLLTIPGIGLLTALWLVVATLNFTGCTRVEELVSYAGLAPRPHQSGTSVRGPSRIGHSGHGPLRKALYLATLSAGQHNALIKPFYTRLRAAGKPVKVARCAAARKLLQLAWAVVMKKQPFNAEQGTASKDLPIAA